MKILSQFILSLVIIATLQGCGFHLRKNQFQLGAKYPIIVLPYGGSHTFHQALRLALAASSIHVVADNSKRPEAPQLIVRTEELDIQPLVYGPDSELRRERLKMTVSFAFLQATQNTHISFSAERDRQLNNSQHLGDNAEKIIIEKEMQADIINQLLRYLDSTHS